MDVKGFPVNHELCHFRQLLRNFPVYFVTRICCNRLPKLRFNHNNSRFSEIILVLIYDPGNVSIVRKFSLVGSSARRSDGFCSMLTLNPTIPVGKQITEAIIKNQRSCGEVTITTPSIGRDWNTVSGTSPVPGGISTKR